MSYESIIITALSGFLGAAIGSVTTLWLHFKNKKNDDRKILNESIHYLMEVFFLVSRLNTEKITSVYLEYYFLQVQKTIPILNEESLSDVKKQISSIIKSKIVPTVQKQTFKNLKTVSKEYENTLTKLAMILPIDAFYLRGKNKLETLINTASLYFENLQVANIEEVEIVRNVLDQMQPSLITSLINEYKEDLKAELLVLLRKTDCFNCKKGKNAIKTIESVELTENDKREIDSMISKVLNQLMQDTSKK